jgi:glucose/arabinose dehydrogenase
MSNRNYFFCNFTFLNKIPKKQFYKKFKIIYLMKNLFYLCFGLISSFGFSQTIALQSFATGFSSPVEIAHPVNDSRLFIVEQTGKIKILNANGTTNATPFLNVASLITTAGGEQGLLGLAFSPDYATNGYFFINYTRTNGDTVIARYSAPANANVAGTTGTIILVVPQPYSNHNGGSIKFGPDGYLYIGMGDGGSGGDPENRSQNINENLGKMLRIDVTVGINPAPYLNPSTNPYVGIAGNDEIWAVGLRNPWKFSFNRLNGDLWIADVGQNLFEEVNKVASPLPNNLNFGWKCKEANSTYSAGCTGLTLTAPIIAVDHNIGSCSITGGYVYTGSLYPNLLGKYLFTDFCNPKIGIVTSSGALTYSTAFTNSNFSTFGEDAAGELYIASIYEGIIYKITDTSLATNNFEPSNFKVYPNPAKGEIFIESSDANYPTEISIFDFNGKLLLTQKTQNLTKNIINTKFLTSGIYLMNIKNNSDVTFTHKLVID